MDVEMTKKIGFEYDTEQTKDGRGMGTVLG